MDHYMRKTYCKTASLMANSCKAVAVLGGHPAADCQLAAEYGRHLGLAFQLVDDIMDFTSTGEAGGCCILYGCCILRGVLQWWIMSRTLQHGCAVRGCCILRGVLHC
jgi:hypothetical protein